MWSENTDILAILTDVETICFGKERAQDSPPPPPTPHLDAPQAQNVNVSLPITIVAVSYIQVMFVFSELKWEITQSNRKNQVRKVCEASSINQPGVTHQMLVDHNNQVMYCYIPKAACSSWKNLLCQLIKEGVSKTTQQLLEERTTSDWHIKGIHENIEKCGVKYLYKQDRATQMKVLNNYTKIMTVRHPIDRIISLYYDKIHVPPDDPSATCTTCNLWGKQIMNHQRKNATAYERSTGRGVTLTEFIEYTADTKHQNEHWNEQYKLCRPCNIKYDYILKTETMAEDAMEVITRAFNSSLPFIRQNTTNKTSVQVSSPASLKTKLLKRYKHDLDMFGFEWKDFKP